MLSPGEGEEEVDRHRPAGELARLAQFSTQTARVEDPDRPQAAGLLDGGGEPVAIDPAAHPGLKQRQLETEPV